MTDIDGKPKRGTLSCCSKVRAIAAPSASASVRPPLSLQSLLLQHLSKDRRGRGLRDQSRRRVREPGSRGRRQSPRLPCGDARERGRRVQPGGTELLRPVRHIAMAVGSALAGPCASPRLRHRHRTPVPPERTHLLLSDKPAWVEVHSGRRTGSSTATRRNRWPSGTSAWVSPAPTDHS